jgi:uncharacterized membrane protein
MEMSFDSIRSKGLTATILIILLPIVSTIISVALFSTKVLASNIYLSILFSLLGYAGYALLLAAMNGLSKIYNDPKIFRNSLYGFITTIIGAIVFIFILEAFLFPTFDQINTFNQVNTVKVISNNPSLSAFLSFLTVVVIVWLCQFVIALFQGIFFRRAFYALAEKSGESKFRTTGLLMLIGGALTIIFVGGLVFFIGWIFAALGFSSMKAQALQTSPLPPQQTPSPAMTQKKYCPQCGSENRVDATFCSHCGNKL